MKNSNFDVDLSSKEWREILLNEKIISPKMLDILKIIFESDDYTATTAQIAKVRNDKDPLFDEKSYNSCIVQNGKRVKEFFNKTPILDEDNNEVFWEWFFEGKKVNGEFHFTLKKELIDALKIIFPLIKGSFSDYLLNKGYYFDSQLIEDYLLSLKIKPFVILTGNSGTGKTKLAQLFVKFISENHSSNFVETSVKVGKADINKGWSLSGSDIKQIIPVDHYEKTYPFIIEDEIEDEGKINLNTRFFYSNKDGKLKEYLANLREKDPNQRVNLKIKLPETSNQYELIPVGPNWTDSRNLLGYYNVITEKYEETPTFKLINEALENPNTPYFLILDEMNLSHVERYFADFLSAIESNEPIPLNSSEEKHESINLPSNLFIVGTVNVDETTYMFSPKVLDRANTIEFETMPAENYMKFDFYKNSLNGDEKYLINPQSDIELREMDISGLNKILKDIKTDDGDLWEVLSSEITSFQNILKQINFDFGFRVINEILRFMIVSWKYEGSPQNWNNWRRYFDSQIKQKILPKLHGSEKVIGNTIHQLFNSCLIQQTNNLPRNFSINENDSKYPKSALKLKEMDKALEKQRYASFIN